jgi:hypothetical protein
MPDERTRFFLYAPAQVGEALGASLADLYSRHLAELNTPGNGTCSSTSTNTHEAGVVVSDSTWLPACISMLAPFLMLSITTFVIESGVAVVCQSRVSMVQ